MPGRAAARTTRTSAVAAKSRAPNPVDTASAAQEAPDEGPSTELRESLCAIFGDVQKSNTGHRKLIVRMRKIQEACCYEPVEDRKRTEHTQFNENDFNTEFFRCVTRVLVVKKSEPAGDRIIKFTGAFLKHSSDIDNAIFQNEGDEMQAVPETPSSRLATQLLATVVHFLPAKDKVVRFRCTQIVAHLINTLDSIDDELYNHIRLGLLKRLRDKETIVRVQAVYGLGRLASEAEVEDQENDDDDDMAGGVLQKLLDVLQNDPSAEVRRSLLMNLPFTPTTLPFLLERARDSDAGIRRALYSRLLPALGDFRHLSLTHREKLLRWGLRDRDQNVKKATARLFRERWIEDCACPRGEDGLPIDTPPGHVSDPSLDGILELLERIDVVNAGNEGGIGLDAMREFWEGRPDYREFITFDEQYWKDLTPESAFVARTFNDFCRLGETSSSLEDKMPEVTRVAYLVQQNVNVLVESLRNAALQEDANEEDSVQQEFIVEQLLHIALTLDYSDEIGRRTMFSLIREILSLAELSEEPTRLAVDLLRTICGSSLASEREFCGVVLEAIAEVHDTIMGEDQSSRKEEGDDSFVSARSEVSGDSTPKASQPDEVDEEKAIKEIMVNMKCLHIAQCMLQNVDCSLEQNAHLVTMLNNLVVPAVRSQEAPIRERGLLCLGLCCLLDKNLATENLTLFLHCFNKGHEALQNIAIQIMGDILAAHPSLLTRSKLEEEQTPEEQALQKSIFKMFSKGLKNPAGPIQSTTCTALCKLMLSSPAESINNGQSILNDDELLELLAISYFDPDTVNNPALRQALSYFLPVYCHSRKANMERMGRIALDVLRRCIDMKEEMDVDGDDEASGDMVGLSVVIAHLVDWTDGRKLAAALSNLQDDASAEADSDVHLDVATEILQKIMGVCSREERKVLVSLLGKLHVSARSDAERLRTVAGLVDEAVEDKIAGDTATKNTLNKLQQVLSKTVSSPTPAPTPHHMRSRAASLAPSIVQEDEQVERLVTDIISNTNEMQISDGKDQADMTLADEQDLTPVPSPKKKPRERQRKARTDEVIQPLSSEPTEIVQTDPAAGGEIETMMAKVKLEPLVENELNMQQPLPEEAPAESDLGKVKEQDEAEKENQQTSEEAAQAAPKRRGRPPKDPSAAKLVSRPRQSVRAGRRKAADVPD